MPFCHALIQTTRITNRQTWTNLDWLWGYDFIFSSIQCESFPQQCNHWKNVTARLFTEMAYPSKYCVVSSFRATAGQHWPLSEYMFAGLAIQGWTLSGTLSRSSQEAGYYKLTHVGFYLSWHLWCKIVLFRLIDSCNHWLILLDNSKLEYYNWNKLVGLNLKLFKMEQIYLTMFAQICLLKPWNLHYSFKLWYLVTAKWVIMTLRISLWKRLYLNRVDMHSIPISQSTSNQL